MEKSSKTILSVIISCFVAYTLIIPSSFIFGLEDSTAINTTVEPSESPQIDATIEQPSKDIAQAVGTSTKSEPQMTEDAKSEGRTSQQFTQADKDSPIINNIPSKHSEQTFKTSSSTDTTPPGRIGTLTAKVVSSNQIDLKWSGVKDSDLHHYNVYRGTKSSFKITSGVTIPTGTSTTNTYSSTGLNPSTTYYYRVAAVDNAGNIGILSSAKSAKTSAAPSQIDTPPQKVSGVSVSSVSSTQINLKWNANKDSDLSHYDVYKGTKSSFTVSIGSTSPAGTTTTNSYSSTGLNPSTTYYYKVAAVDKAGHSSTLSSAKSGKTKPGHGDNNDTTPPAKVTGLTIATVSSSQLDLSWNK